MLDIKGSWGAADLAAFIRCYHGTYVKLLRLSTSWGVEWQGSAGGAEHWSATLRCGAYCNYPYRFLAASRAVAASISPNLSESPLSARLSR